MSLLKVKSHFFYKWAIAIASSFSKSSSSSSSELSNLTRLAGVTSSPESLKIEVEKKTQVFTTLYEKQMDPKKVLKLA